MRLTYALFILVVSIYLSSCATNNKINSESIKRAGIDMIIMRNDSKNAYFKDFNSMEKFCASRGSDSISVSQQEFQLGVSALDKSDNIGEESGSGAIALGGRSPTVLITRELMYRACELTLNINADNDKTLEIYKIFLDYVLKIVKNEHDIGSNTNSAIMSNNSGNQDEDSDDY